MQIIMKDTRRGSEDGFTVQQFFKGKTYDLRDTLARTFIRSGYAECIESKTMEQVVQEIIENNRKAMGAI